MKAIKENLGGIATFLFELIVGILLLVNPEGFTTAIITGAGIVLVLAGLGSVIRYFRTEPIMAMRTQDLSKGLIALLFGCFCLTQAGWLLAKLSTVLTSLYGAVILITGLTKVQWTLDIIRMKKKKWILAALSAAVTIICGLVVITNPFGTAQVLWMFIGISLIVEAAFDVVSLIFGINGREKAFILEPEELDEEESQEEE